ncbi:endonuclease/exonuclease/phosphatase family protein [Rubrivirga sp. IMCC45206]|uniref:endonuclease/exonuclease/phosphatase family protein n=1 Tax=Rubrivirga sp. IMCC45206 TaxID=3391614 RepID=UPI00398F9685
MRTLLLAALAVLLGPGLAAQSVPARGADDTFDVAAWNMEHFGNPSEGPTNDPLQLRNAEAIIAGAEIDVWAVQEVGDQQAWSDLLASLADDGYTGRLGPTVPGSFQLRLGFIYNPSVVQVIGTRTILSGGNFGGRAPFEMQATVRVDGESRSVRIISLHAKAGTQSDDYTDRQNGAEALKAYIDDRVALGEDVILMGDFNDFLTRSIRIGQPSPYLVFTNDTAGYVAATLPVENRGEPTLCNNATCTSGSTRDHILFTSGLADEYVDDSGDRFIEVVDGVPGYVTTTSDHLPVLARFSFRTTSAEGDRDGRAARLLATAPNPSRGAARLRFRLDAPADVRLDVVDALGRIVASVSGAYGPGTHAVALDGAALAPGAYTVRLSAGGALDVGRLVRVR